MPIRLHGYAVIQINLLLLNYLPTEYDMFVIRYMYTNKETMQDLRELFTTMSPNYSGEATIFANTIRPTHDKTIETDAVRDIATPPQTKKDINN